jgi:putative OmpL-like beta-barrel porin-2
MECTPHKGRGHNKVTMIIKGESMNRKKIVRFVCSALVAGTVASAAPVFAEEAKPAGLKPDEVKSALGISFYVQGGYTYNGNATDGATKSSENDLRVFDHKANSFGVDLAQIVALKDVTKAGDGGYKIKLSTGETAKWIHARGLSGATLDKPQFGEGTDTIDVTEAYVSYLAPVGKGLRFDAGKMVTYFGAEVIEAIDNPNYSRSFLFNYAIPFTHTGVKASYAFTDTLNASFHVVNGWDNAEDNNSGKCVGVSLGYAPAEIFSGYVNFMTGPEQDNNSSNKRTLVDLVATIKPMKPLSFILNYDDGKEDKAIATTGADAKWSGFAGIVKYDFNDKFSLAVRGESFDDKDGFRTGTVQKLTEVTVTPEIRLTGGVILRPEYRHDSSDKQSFDNGTKKSQDTVALAAMYRW